MGKLRHVLGGREAVGSLSLLRFIDGVLGQLALNDITKVEQMVNVPFADMVFQDTFGGGQLLRLVMCSQ